MFHQHLNANIRYDQSSNSKRATLEFTLGMKASRVITNESEQNIQSNAC